MPEIRKLLVATTGHVTEASRKWLNAQALDVAQAAVENRPSVAEFHIAGSKYGWIFYANEEPVAPIPLDVIAIMLKTRELGCDYIMLDCDADPLEGLQTYDW